jgi:hypothetical protein
VVACGQALPREHDVADQFRMRRQMTCFAVGP